MSDRFLAALLMSGLTATLLSSAYANGNAEAGKVTFEQHNCNRCHVEMFGGDGSKIFTRADRKIKSRASLTTQITRCSTNLGLMLFEDDEEGLVAYLNNEYYKFK
jgi:cytochrome c551/c552